MLKLFLAILAAALFAVILVTALSTGKTVTGKVIQLEEEKVTLTGEKLTTITLIGDKDGANYFLAINGHGLRIKTGDRLEVVYSKGDLAAHRTDKMGNRWNYWRVKQFKILSRT